MKRQRLATFLERAGLHRLVARCLPARGIVILNYHRIGDSLHSLLDRELWSTCEESFDRQIMFLKEHCDVISPAEIDAAQRDARGLHVLITFDDGYIDNFELAFPTLRRHRVPATFFIATGFIDQPRLPWWDEIAATVRTSPLKKLVLENWFTAPLSIAPGHRQRTINRLLGAYKTLPAERAADFLGDLGAAATVPDLPGGDDLWMTWDMIREMATQGMTIGGHTVNHVILSSIAPEEQWREISGCANRIEQELGSPMSYFAYPVGGRDSFNAETWRCLERAGVRYAFSYYGGFASPTAHHFDMPRMAIEPYIGPEWFRAMVRMPRLFCPASRS